MRGTKSQFRHRSYRRCWRHRAFNLASFTKSLAGRGNLGDQVANELLVRQRGECHGARLEAGGAGIDRVAVELDHALLAGIGIDAGEAHRQRRVLVDTQPAQAVEHRLAGLEGDLVGLPLRRVAVAAALDFQRCDLLGIMLGFLAHDASTFVFAATGALVISISVPISLTCLCSCHCGSVAGQSSRWCAPRLSARSSADQATAWATKSILRRSNHSSRCRLKAAARPSGRSPRSRPSAAIFLTAPSNFSFVRNGPTSSAMMFCNCAIAAALLKG